MKHLQHALVIAVFFIFGLVGFSSQAKVSEQPVTLTDDSSGGGGSGGSSDNQSSEYAEYMANMTVLVTELQSEADYEAALIVSRKVIIIVCCKKTEGCWLTGNVSGNACECDVPSSMEYYECVNGPLEPEIEEGHL